MLSGWRTIWYFTWRGLFYAMTMGAIAGTFVYPIIGSGIGFLYGGGVGLIMGILLGIGVHFYNRKAYYDQMAFEDYQTNLVTYAELGTAIVTAVPLLFILAPVAGLAAAYVTHRYAEDHAHHIIKRKNDALLPNTLEHMEKPDTINKFTDYLVARAKRIAIPILILVNVVVLGLMLFDYAIPYSFASVLGGIVFASVGFGVYSSIIVGLVGAANGMFIQMLNRVVFSPELTHEQYKKRVMIIAGLFTLVITPIVGLGIGAPILAVLAALAARDYADWHFNQTSDEKVKHKAKRLTDTNDVHIRSHIAEAENELIKYKQVQ